jgi:hypothetical protein
MSHTTKTCDLCGEPFTPNRSDQMFCSRACSKKMSWCTSDHNDLRRNRDMQACDELLRRLQASFRMQRAR